MTTKHRPRLRPKRASLAKQRPEWPMLAKAAQLPGRTLHLGLAIWGLVLASGSPKVTLTPVALVHFGLSREAAYEGLTRLTEAGVVTVERGRGRRAMVTWLGELEPMHNG